MKTERAFKGVKEIVHLLDETDLRIDEKMAACRAAGDFYNQVFSTESLILSMQKAMINVGEPE